MTFAKNAQPVLEHAAQHREKMPRDAQMMTNAQLTELCEAEQHKTLAVATAITCITRLHQATEWHKH